VPRAKFGAFVRHVTKISLSHPTNVGTAIKHPVPDRLKPSFVIFDIRAL